MYHESTRRTTTLPTNLRLPKCSIPQPDIEFDEHVKYLESILAVLNESRFGWRSADPAVIDLSGKSRLEPVFLSDLMGDEIVQVYIPSPQGRADFQVADATFLRAKWTGLADAGQPLRNSPSDLTPNQGRGSPE
jgi:hypothetical protein